MEDKNCCKHWECPYKYCIWHENHDEELEVPKFWSQEYKNPITCTYYMDI